MTTTALTADSLEATSRLVIELEYEDERETHILTAAQFAEEFSPAEQDRLLTAYKLDIPARITRHHSAFAFTLRHIKQEA